jgi:hypothetical protein
MGLRVSLDAVEKILDPTGTQNSDPSVVQPVASRYTHCAIPAPTLNHFSDKVTKLTITPHLQRHLYYFCELTKLIMQNFVYLPHGVGIF